MDTSKYVWYASYGSNLCEERFLCYIKGGTPFGSTKRETGCRDQSMPLKSVSVLLPYPLYFASYSNRWGGGVAFVDTTSQKENTTLGRMYLITKEQFIDVVKQENNNLNVKIDFDKVVKDKAEIVSKSLYGQVLYAGISDGYPIFTFTHQQNQIQRIITVPSESYLNMLIRGYRETYSFSDDQIVEYLLSKPGIDGEYSRDQLMILVRHTSK